MCPLSCVNRMLRSQSVVRTIDRERPSLLCFQISSFDWWIEPRYLDSAQSVSYPMFCVLPIFFCLFVFRAVLRVALSQSSDTLSAVLIFNHPHTQPACLEIQGLGTSWKAPINTPAVSLGSSQKQNLTCRPHKYTKCSRAWEEIGE
jgi:hypothetical protein